VSATLIDAILTPVLFLRYGAIPLQRLKQLVARGNTLDVFITDHDDKATPTKGFKGTAILVVKGKAQRIMLAPRGDNILTGTSPVELAAPIRGAIQITNTDNQTVQAKF
jgi:hypothetical protein